MLTIMKGADERPLVLGSLPLVLGSLPLQDLLDSNFSFQCGMSTVPMNGIGLSEDTDVNTMLSLASKAI
jgi:hypothetical protein